jgi:hypothetical protein
MECKSSITARKIKTAGSSELVSRSSSLYEEGRTSFQARVSWKSQTTCSRYDDEDENSW